MSVTSTDTHRVSLWAEKGYVDSSLYNYSGRRSRSGSGTHPKVLRYQVELRSDRVQQCVTVVTKTVSTRHSDGSGCTQQSATVAATRLPGTSTTAVEDDGNDRNNQE